MYRWLSMCVCIFTALGFFFFSFVCLFVCIPQVLQLGYRRKCKKCSDIDRNHNLRRFSSSGKISWSVSSSLVSAGCLDGFGGGEANFRPNVPKSRTYCRNLFTRLNSRLYESKCEPFEQAFAWFSVTLKIVLSSISPALEICIVQHQRKFSADVRLFIAYSDEVRHEYLGRSYITRNCMNFNLLSYQSVDISCRTNSFSYLLLQQKLRCEDSALLLSVRHPRKWMLRQGTFWAKIREEDIPIRDKLSNVHLSFTLSLMRFPWRKKYG